MKLNYTEKELKALGWATIGGRIEDYALTAWFKGNAAAYREIKKDYGCENVDDVYRGLIVYTNFSTNAYYSPRWL